MLLLNIEFVAAPDGFSSAIVSFGIAAIYVSSKIGQVEINFYFSSYMLALLGAAFFSFLMALGGAVTEGIYEYNLFSLPIRVIGYLLSALFLVLWWRGGRAHENVEALTSLMTLAVYVYTFHSLVILLQYFSNPIMSMSYSVFDVGKVSDPPISQFRMGGLTGDQPGTSFAHGIVAGMAYYAFLKTKRLSFLLAYLLITLSMVFLARSGLYIGMSAPLFFLLTTGKRMLSYSIFATLSLLFFVFLLTYAYPANDAVVRSKEILESYLSSGEFSSRSTDDLLQNHWSVVPHDPLSLFFGTGVSSTSDLGLRTTDVGYLRLVWLSGLFGLTLILLSHFYAFSGLLIFSRDNWLLRRLFLMFFASWLFYNFKGYNILGGPWFFFLILFLLWFTVRRGNEAQCGTGAPKKMPRHRHQTVRPEQYPTVES